MSALGCQRKQRTPLWRGLVVVLALVPAFCQALCLPPQGQAPLAQEVPSAEHHGCHGMAMAEPVAQGASQKGGDPSDHSNCCDPTAPPPASDADPVPEMLLAGLLLPPAFASETHCFAQATIRGPPVSSGPPLTLLHCHFTE